MTAEPISARIELTFDDMETAQIVFHAISPDNKPLPSGLELNSSLESRTIVMEITCYRQLASLLATIDDILRMAALAENTVKNVR